jgi:glycosyltransferase involved in cell wall biosynthesis
MRIVVNDHSGHAFPIQLSRHLAAGGHEILHSYSTSFQSPKGDLHSHPADPGTLSIFPISTPGIFAKYSLFKRRRQEIAYAKQLIARLQNFRPQVILGGTAPLFVQAYLQAYAKKEGIPFVYWCQDLYSIAIEGFVKSRIGWLGFPIWTYFHWLETKLLRKSTAIISITEDFCPLFSLWKVDMAKVTYIPNWAPVEQLHLSDKINPWSIEHRFADRLCLTYSGTLGLKHNPEMLLAAARYFLPVSRVSILVISEGLGADLLQKEKKRQDLSNLHILPFQDFEVMEQVMGASDVLLGLLEESAGHFSVPSKILTYLCARKPIVLAAPSKNLSTRIVQDSGAGYCVDPGDEKGFCQKLKHLIEEPGLRESFSINGRTYAEKHFCIREIADRFMEVLSA